MTCIAGIAEKGKVWIGGDSAASAGSEIQLRRDDKIFASGDFLVGFAGSWRVGQALRYGRYLPKVAPRKNLEGFLVGLFASRVAECVAKKDVEEKNATTLLIGIAGRLFKIDTDFQVAEALSGSDAIGAGAPYALGSLHSTQGDPYDRIDAALSAAEECCGIVRRPFIIKSL